MHDCLSGCLDANESLWDVFVCVLNVFVVYRTLSLCEVQLYSCYIAVLLMHSTYTYLHIQQHTQLTHSPSSRHCSLSLSLSLSGPISLSVPLPRFLFLSVLEKHWKSTAVDSCILFSQSELSRVLPGAQTLSTLYNICPTTSSSNELSLSSSLASLFSLLPECLCTTCDRLHYRLQIYTGTAGAARGPAANWATHTYSDLPLKKTERDGTCPFQATVMKMKIKKVQWWWFQVTA